MAKAQITYLHPKGNEEDSTDECELELEFDLEYTPGEVYGSDADGNRGVWRSGYMERGEDAPPVCLECGHVFSLDERKEIEDLMDQAAETYEPDNDYYPEPDDYD